MPLIFLVLYVYLGRKVHRGLMFLLVMRPFALHTASLLRQYPQRGLNDESTILNCRYLSRSRRTVECAFGVLANKWRVLHILLF